MIILSAVLNSVFILFLSDISSQFNCHRKYKSKLVNQTGLDVNCPLLKNKNHELPSSSESRGFILINTIYHTICRNKRPAPTFDNSSVI